MDLPCSIKTEAEAGLLCVPPRESVWGSAVPFGEEEARPEGRREGLLKHALVQVLSFDAHGFWGVPLDLLSEVRRISICWFQFRLDIP